MNEIERATIPDKDIADLSWLVRVVADDYQPAAPDDEGATPRQIAAYQRGDWYYVGVIVSAVIGGQVLTDVSDSLWMCDYGQYVLTDEDDNVTGGIFIDLDVMTNGRKDRDGREISSPYPVPDLIEEARGHLAEYLAARITAWQDVAAALAAEAEAAEADAALLRRREGSCYPLDR